MGKSSWGLNQVQYPPSESLRTMYGGKAGRAGPASVGRRAADIASHSTAQALVGTSREELRFFVCLTGEFFF